MIFGVLIAKIIEFILKTAFFIPRPYIVNHQPTFVTIPPIDSSFPSFHTMIAFTLATIIFIKNRRLGLFLFVVAATIGAARIAANIHYPLDVIGGLIMGVTIGISCGKITFYARHHYPSTRSKKSRR